MTTIAVPFPAAAPTRFERLLLAVSARLTEVAGQRMLRRAASSVRADLRASAGEAQRDAASSVRAGMLPR
jgi:hypothetical protein